MCPGGTAHARRSAAADPAHLAGRDALPGFPGGHVESGDPSLRAALAREIREETGAEPQITGLLQVPADEYQRQYFYLACIGSWSEADRTGPEFGDPDRGEYQLEEVPLTVGASVPGRMDGGSGY